jgi:asparagine synthase (glutamine-hydrolysing)
MNESAVASRLEEVAWYSETFCADVNAMGKLAMSEMVHSRGFKVVVTGALPVLGPFASNNVSLGEGSDEHFAGYSFFATDFLSEADHSWPALFTSEQTREEALKAASQPYDIMQRSELHQGPPPSTDRMLNSTKMNSILCSTTSLPYGGWTDRCATTTPETALAESFDGTIYDKMQNKWHPLNTACYIWTKTLFPNILLRYVGDNIDMVHHVESRTPFLDHHLTEYANGLPPSLKLKFDPATKQMQEKFILREAVKPFVTEEIYTRRKQPFLGPVEYSADGPLYKAVKKLVTKDNVRKLGFLDWNKTEGLAEKAFVEHEHSAFRNVLAVAQLVALSKRFRVKTAEPVH